MSVLVITPPAALVGLEEAKAHLRLTTNGEDDLVTAYIAAACAWVDGPAGWLGRSLGTQTLELRTSAFGCSERLPYGPVQAIDEIKYVDPQGVEQELTDGFELVADHLVLSHGASWPAVRGDPHGVRIRYVAGEDVPPLTAKQAVLLLIGQWFRNRMAVNVGNIVNEMPFGVEALLAPLRRF